MEVSTLTSELSTLSVAGTKSYAEAAGKVAVPKAPAEEGVAGTEAADEEAEIKPEEPEEIVRVRRVKNRDGYEGYEVETTKQTVALLIESGNFCCEEYGTEIELPKWMKSPRALQGALLHSVYWGRDPKPPERFYRWDACAVHLDTDRGRVRLIAYNYHNGYYTHNVRASWAGYQDEQRL